MNAIAFYNAGLEALQEQILSKDNVVSNNYGELSNYYGKSIKMDQAIDFKVLYKEFSLICRYYAYKDGIVFQRIEFEMQCLFILLYRSDLSGERCGCD